MEFFSYEHLPEPLKRISQPVCDLARQMDAILPAGAEKATGLRKLLEAKDCFVQQLLVTAAGRRVHVETGGILPAPDAGGTLPG